jgi:hypothetical protein
MLQAGTPVQTKEGIYTPQTDEIWHSHLRWLELENNLTDAIWQIQRLRKDAEK